ncbi:MAG: four helix bundle protein [Chitinophagaceae bacterium]|nr:four helix bundle protein [Chitinophagaceae bacterium]
MKENIIVNKSYQFAIRIVKLYIYLKDEKKEFHLSVQILKSGTSIGANIEEALGGSSRKDFKAKMDISYKETRETLYWLRLLKDTNFINIKMFKSLFTDCEEILKILTAIINTLKV